MAVIILYNTSSAIIFLHELFIDFIASLVLVLHGTYKKLVIISKIKCKCMKDIK